MSVPPDLRERARRLISQHFDRPDVAIDARFCDDLGADSLDFNELLFDLEDEFGVAVPDDEAERCVTVGDAIDLLERLLRADAYVGQAS